MNRFVKIGAGGKTLGARAQKFDIVLEPARKLMWDARETETMTMDNALQHVAALNKAKFGGFKDWRLPIFDELILLPDRSRYNPAIDTRFFPGCKNGWYWTSSPAACSPGECAWSVDFYYGSAGWSNRDGHGFVRPVRSARVGQ